MNIVLAEKNMVAPTTINILMFYVLCFIFLFKVRGRDKIDISRNIMKNTILLKTLSFPASAFINQT